MTEASALIFNLEIASSDINIGIFCSCKEELDLNDTASAVLESLKEFLRDRLV